MMMIKTIAGALAVTAFSITAVAACTHNPPPGPPPAGSKPCVVYGVSIQNCPPELIARLPSPSSSPSPAP